MVAVEDQRLLCSARQNCCFLSKESGGFAESDIWFMTRVSHRKRMSEGKVHFNQPELAIVGAVERGTKMSFGEFYFVSSVFE